MYVSVFVCMDKKCHKHTNIHDTIYSLPIIFFLAKGREGQVRDCFVYFIQGSSTGMVKIGMTANVAHRLGSLQSSSPDKLRVLALIESNQGDSVYLQEFSKYCSHGEWFFPAPKLMSFIASIPYVQSGVPFELFTADWYRNKRRERRVRDFWEAKDKK